MFDFLRMFVGGHGRAAACPSSFRLSQADLYAVWMDSGAVVRR